MTKLKIVVAHYKVVIAGIILQKQWQTVDFENLEEKEICVVKVTPSEKPAFLKKEGKGLFFIRTNNETRELDAQETLEHYQQ
jgi:hypothetical protein